MKIRKGFVSNSSSSSFIVVGRVDKDLELIITIKTNIKEYVSDIIRTKEKLYINDEINELVENESVVLADLEKILDEGKSIYIGSFSNEGDPIESLLYHNGLPKNSSCDIIYNPDY